MTDRVAIWFRSNDGIGAWLIRSGTMSQWNHVGIEINGEIYDATYKDGVKKRSFESFMQKGSSVEAIMIEDLPKIDAAKKFLEDQVNKKYDWLAILAFPFRKSWNNDNAWFCSELAAEFLRKGGRSLNLPSRRVTPRDLYVSL